MRFYYVCNLKKEKFNLNTKQTQWIRLPLSLKGSMAVVKIAVFFCAISTLSWVIFLYLIKVLLHLLEKQESTD